MARSDTLDLLLLSALWGASFMLLRYAAPAFGPVALIAVRVGVAALVLLPLLWRRGQLAQLRRHPAALLTVGALNSALPFVLLAYATLSVTAGFAAILNATTPFWAAVVAALALGQRIGRRQAAGLAIGFAGVVILVWGKVDFRPGGSGWAIASALLAAASYGLAASFARRTLPDAAPLVIATGSQLGATALLAVPAALAWPPQPPSAPAWVAVLVLAVACTAFAYLLYFRLMARIGVVRSSAVTFLVPLFAAAWGAALLGETVTAQSAAGGAIILAGTALALDLLPGRRPAAAR